MKTRSTDWELKRAWAMATPENWHRLVVGHVRVPDFHKEWFRLLRRHKKLMIKAPRGHAKTEVFSVSYSSWWAANNPNDLVMIFSANEYPQAQQIIKRIAHVFQSSPLVKNMVEGQPTKRWIKLKNNTLIMAAGVGMQVRGLAGVKKRPGLLVFDDILPDPGSTLTMDRVEEWFWDTAIPMGRPDSRVVVVGTPFTVDDLLAKLEQNEEYLSRVYPAWKEDPETGEIVSVLWPDQWALADPKGDPVAALKRKRREVGSLAFARQYLCQPVDDASSLFPRRLLWSSTWKVPVSEERKWLADPVVDRTWRAWVEHGWWSTVGVDLAISSHVGADSFAVAIAWHLDVPVNPDTDTAWLRPAWLRPSLREEMGLTVVDSFNDNDEEWVEVPSFLAARRWKDVTFVPPRDCDESCHLFLSPSKVEPHGRRKWTLPSLSEVERRAEERRIVHLPGDEWRRKGKRRRRWFPEGATARDRVSVLMQVVAATGWSHERQLEFLVAVSRAVRPRVMAIEANGFQAIIPRMLMDNRSWYKAMMPSETMILPVTTTHSLKTSLGGLTSRSLARVSLSSSSSSSGESLLRQVTALGSRASFPSIPAMQHEWFESGRLVVLIPFSSSSSHEEEVGDLLSSWDVKAWVQEFTNFSWRKTPGGQLTLESISSSVHDDRVMATWLAFVASRSS